MVSPASDDDHPARRLGRKLREARIAAGYRSQEQFGEAMNMHRTTVTKVENGTRHVTTDVLRKWCELCHVDFELYEASARIDLQQQTIERRPVPATLIAVMDEAVLHRRVGSEEVRYRQLTHLVEQGQRKHIGIQVVPASRGANAGNVGAFTIASLDDADVMLMGAVEDVTTDKRATIRTGLAIFDRVRLDAFSGPESLELILKVAEECKP